MPRQANFYAALRRRDEDWIVRRFEPLARSIAKNYYLPGGSRDDVLQEARFGIAKAVRDFRAHDLSLFPPFAAMCAKRQVISAVIAAHRKKHALLNESWSLDAPAPTVLQDVAALQLADILAIRNDDPLELMLRDEELAAVLTLIDGMTVVERTAFEVVVFADGSYDEAAEIAGTNVKAIDNALGRARRKLRALREAA